MSQNENSLEGERKGGGKEEKNKEIVPLGGRFV